MVYCILAKIPHLQFQQQIKGQTLHLYQNISIHKERLYVILKDIEL